MFTQPQHSTGPARPTSQLHPDALVPPLDQEAGRAEGWEVARSGSGRDAQAQLRRIEPAPGAEPAFGSDYDVWHHAVRMARAGSDLYRAALAAVDDTERMLIEAACGSW